MQPLSRRTFLRGVVGGAAVTVALPTLEAMLNGHGTAFAQGMPFPKRFGIWFWGNGVQLNRWIQRTYPGDPEPARVRQGWWNHLSAEVGPSPLEILRDRPNLKERVSLVTATQVPVNTGSVHNEGRCALMTGSFDRAIGQFGASTLPSADQIMAAERRTLTPFASLEVGVSDTAPNVSASRTRGETSTRGDGVFLPMEKDPLALYDRLFGTSSEPRNVRAAKLNSVVSAVQADACRLKAKLGRTDQQRLATHMDSLSDLERRVTTAPVCAAPRPASAFGRTNDGQGFTREQLDARNGAICDLLVYALKCDLTRTFCFEFTPYQAATIFPGSTTDSHTLTHSETIDVTGSLGTVKGSMYVNDNVRFTMARFADLLERMNAVEEAPGVTLLDNSAIITGTDVNQGYYHGLFDMPLIVAGRAGGALKSGAAYRYKDEPSARAMLTVMRACGSTAQRFGAGSLQVERPFSEMLT